MTDPIDFETTLPRPIGMEGTRMLGRYVLKRKLGQGGMGVVWLAHDETLSQDVALKFLPDMVVADPESLADLKRETRRSLALTHPHIVRIHDFVTDGSVGAISMEFVNGESLSAMKTRKPDGWFEVEEIRGWMRQACEALEYAHARAKVVHRDLKPGNLLIAGNGDLKVSDFGIACNLRDSITRMTGAMGPQSGTPAYMSPQQLTGDDPSVPDDIYSLGATLCDLLTGKPPFHGGDIQWQIREKIAPPMAERRAGRGAAIPANWEDTVAACLAKTPADRPQSAREMAGMLGLIPGYKPLPRKPGRTTIQSGKPGKYALVVGLATLLFGAGMAGWWLGIEAPKREARHRAQIAMREQQAREADAARTRLASEEARAQAIGDALNQGRNALTGGDLAVAREKFYQVQGMDGSNEDATKGLAAVTAAEKARQQQQAQAKREQEIAQLLDKADTDLKDGKLTDAKAGYKAVQVLDAHNLRAQQGWDEVGTQEKAELARKVLEEQRRQLAAEEAARKQKADDEERARLAEDKRRRDADAESQRAAADTEARLAKERHEREAAEKARLAARRTATLAPQITFSLESVRLLNDQTIALSAEFKNTSSREAVVYTGNGVKIEAKKMGVSVNYPSARLQDLDISGTDNVGTRFICNSSSGFSIDRNGYIKTKFTIYDGLNHYVVVPAGESAPITLNLADTNASWGSGQNRSGTRPESIDLTIEFHVVTDARTMAGFDKTVRFSGCPIE